MRKGVRTLFTKCGSVAVFLVCTLTAACTTDPGSDVACTMEAKACPNGSYVVTPVYEFGL